MQLTLFVLKMILVSIMNEKKTSIVSKIAWIVLMVVKVIFFKGKNAWLTFY